jgi:hypothetical protein
MSKNFFIVVPYTASVFPGTKKSGFSFPFFGSQKNTQRERAKDWLENFEESKTQIEQRVSVIESGLSRIGIRLVQLGTEEVIELFYKIFNPGELDKPIQP